MVEQHFQFEMIRHLILLLRRQEVVNVFYIPMTRVMVLVENASSSPVHSSLCNAGFGAVLAVAVIFRHNCIGIGGTGPAKMAEFFCRSCGFVTSRCFVRQIIENARVFCLYGRWSAV